jgi:hypothetical protein
VKEAQGCNLLYRRFASGGLFEVRAASGLKIRDTAEYNSALRDLRQFASFADELKEEILL